MKAAVMFSGAAGTSVGARQAGAEIVWAANHNRVCVDTHAANFPHAQNVCQDLHLFRRLDYKVSEQVLNSEAWKVPQARERLFVIGTLGPRPIRIRDPKQFTPCPMGDFIDWDGGEWMPFSEACGPGMRAQLIKADQVLGDEPGAISLVSHRPVFRADEPLRTMTTKDQFRWVYRKRFRYPTAREAFALMGFPDDYVIPDHVVQHRTIAWAMAGDAVCPPMMRGIVARVMAA